jgi:hypothetical protein
MRGLLITPSPLSSEEKEEMHIGWGENLTSQIKNRFPLTAVVLTFTIARLNSKENL